MKHEQAMHAAPVVKKGLFDFLKRKPALNGARADATDQAQKSGQHLGAGANVQTTGQQAGEDAPSQVSASFGGKAAGSTIVPNKPNAGKFKDGSSKDKQESKSESSITSLRGFYPIASVVARLFPMIEFELEAAGKKQGAVEYISNAIFVFTVCFAFLALLTGLVVQIRFSDGIDFRFRVAAVAFSALVSFGIFFYFMLIPKWMSGQKMALINQDLLFATRHLMIETSAGVPLYDAIVSVSEDFDDSSLSYDKKGREYGEVGREFAHIVLEVRSGKDLTTALEESAAASPSENFRKVVWQLSNANRTGTKIGLVLHETVNFLAAEQIISIRNYGAQLSTLALFYMLGCIIAPTMGIVVLAIGANILPDLPVNESTFMAILVLLALVQAFFVGMIKSRRPTVSL